MWNSFEEFRGDMEDSFNKHIQKHGAKNTTIDRIDSSGNYSKENCRWATYKVQNDNRKIISNAVAVDINGVKKPLGTWAIELGIVNQATVYSRYYRLGWSAEKSLLTPSRNYVRK